VKLGEGPFTAVRVLKSFALKRWRVLASINKMPKFPDSAEYLSDFRFSPQKPACGYNYLGKVDFV
jgi:hypothetical protein